MRAQSEGTWDYQPQSSACCPLTILVQLEPKKPALWLGDPGSNPAAAQLTEWAEKTPFGALEGGLLQLFLLPAVVA